MSFIFWFLVLIALAFVILKLKEDSGRERSDPLGFEKAGPLFTAAERSFLGVLDQALGQQYRIMGKVRLADLIKPKTNPNRGAWRRAFNQIQSKHVDFVGCDPSMLAVKFVIELDDSSHNQPKRQERDDFLNKALQSAGIPVYHFSVKRAYTLEEVQKTILVTKQDGINGSADARKDQANQPVKPGNTASRSSRSA